MKFESIIGHDDIVENLKTMVEREEINHALLFEGIGGIGKKYTAKVFANSILCLGKSDNECIPNDFSYINDSNPDYLFLTSENNTLKKAQIEELIDFMSIRPFDSRYKVAIVEDFDKATKEAQNALLKTLEEAPSYGKMILLSENKKNILETVLSRVKLYTFTPIKKTKLIEYLIKNYDIEENEASFYADYSNGSLGKAIRIIKDEDFRQNRRQAVEIFDRALKSEGDYVLKNIGFFENIENIDTVLDMYLTWLRDLLIFKKTNKGRHLINRDLERIIRSETHLSDNQINNIKEKIIELKENLKYNVTEDLALELFFIDVMEECEWKKQ